MDFIKDDLSKIEIYKVKAIFPLNDKEQLYITLEADEWQHIVKGEMYLCYNKIEKIKLNYIACGNIKGNLVINVSPDKETNKSVVEIAKLFDSNMHIERKIET